MMLPFAINPNVPAGLTEPRGEARRLTRDDQRPGRQFNTENTNAYLQSDRHTHHTC
jgi:hypothetical protein